MIQFYSITERKSGMNHTLITQRIVSCPLVSLGTVLINIFFCIQIESKWQKNCLNNDSSF